MWIDVIAAPLHTLQLIMMDIPPDESGPPLNLFYIPGT